MTKGETRSLARFRNHVGPQRCLACNVRKCACEFSRMGCCLEKRPHKIRLKWYLGLLSYPYLQLPCHSSSLLFKGASHCSMSWQFRQGCLHRQPRVTSRFWSEVRETAAQNGNSVPALSHLSVRTADYSIRRLSSCTVASLMPSPLHHSGEGTRRSDTDSGPSINDFNKLFGVSDPLPPGV